MTLGRTDRDVRVLGRALVVLEDRLEDLAKLIERNPESPAGDRGDNSFTDAQVEWLKAFHEDRDNIKWGKVFFRLVLSAAGAAAVATVSILFTYFHFKG